jgi:RNA polymerase sigma factor (TIGR02999 family)
MGDPPDTNLIRSLEEPDGGSADAYQQVHECLRLAAISALRRGGPPTLTPTALVNEAWLKLHGHFAGVRDRQHFLALAATAMRQILADHARGQRAVRRAARRTSISVSEIDGKPDSPSPDENIDVVSLDEALTKLAGLNERQARVVELRFLCSLTIQQAADVLGVSHATVESDWSIARAWLRRELARCV